MLAILNMGAPELVVVLVIGVLLFGRKLPEVGRSVGQTVAKLRKGVHEFKEQIDRDDSLREVRDSVRDIHGELRSTMDAPKRALRDTVLGSAPSQAKTQVKGNEAGVLANLTDPKASTPAPDSSPGNTGPG